MVRITSTSVASNSTHVEVLALVSPALVVVFATTLLVLANAIQVTQVMLASLLKVNSKEKYCNLRCQTVIDLNARSCWHS